MIEIYTDGACKGNPGAGGWAAVILDGDTVIEELSGGVPETTNNIMELTAVREALRYVCGIERTDEILVYSDSQYICKAFNDGWLDNWKNAGWLKSDGTAPKNLEIWQELDRLTAPYRSSDTMTRDRIQFSWVKGHSGNPYNERCDKLAVKASRDVRQGKGAVSEPTQEKPPMQEDVPAEEQVTLLPVPRMGENPDVVLCEKMALQVLDMTLMENHAISCNGDARPCGSRPYCKKCEDAEGREYPCARAYIHFRLDVKETPKQLPTWAQKGLD